MKNENTPTVTVGHVVERTFKSGSRLQALLDDPMMEMPLEHALRHKSALVKRFQQIPHIGAKTANTAAQALEDYSELLKAESGQMDGQACDDAVFAAGDDDLGEQRSPLRYQSGEGFELHRIQTHPFWLLQHSNSAKVFYLPRAIPSIMLTKPVWQAQYGQSFARQSYRPRYKDVLELGVPVGTTIEIIIDNHVWSSLKNRRGCYVGLLESEVQQQIRVLAQAQQMLSNRIFFSSVCFQEYGLSNCMLAEGSFFCTNMFDDYYVSDHRDVVKRTLLAIKSTKRSPLSLSVR